MPSTVNGIGTHYYGKKNIQKRTSACHSCGRTVELVSYDTRLWFVVFFIPIFPLKRILDYCPACTRHYAVEADKWETAKQLEVSGAQEKFRTEPTADNAIAAHQQLLHFHQVDEAAEFQKTMTAKFADNAKVHAYLGAALAHIGKLDEAKPFYVRALELRPDLPEARIGVALAHIREGKLDDARKLLDFLEQPGASKLYSLEGLDKLARAYQNASRHDEALEIFSVIQRELPKVAEEKWFRNLVAKSEKDSGRRESQLPKVKFSWKRIFAAGGQSVGKPQVTWRSLMIVGIILGLIGVGMAISNEYIRRHRKLHIVSGYKDPALVEIRGRGAVRTSRGAIEMILPEGRYHAVINGPLKQEVDFEIRSGYWGRWFDDPAWVLNVGGSVLLEVARAVYASHDSPPVEYSFAFGEPFRHFTGITHVFQELPESVQLNSGSTRTLTGLNTFRREPSMLFHYFTQNRNVPEALRLAEWRLRLQPDDDMMLTLYFAHALPRGETARIEKFLRSGLTNRPVLVQWHRYYQNMHRDRRHNAELAAEYDAQLQVEPTNSALMYLRGRVSDKPADSRMWFQRACDADTNNAYAFYARGNDRMAAGDWASAKPLLARACQLRPKQIEFNESLRMARVALRDYDALEKELREQLKTETLNSRAMEQLCDVLVAQGRSAEAIETARTFQIAVGRESRGNLAEASRNLHQHLLYVTGDFATLEKETANAKDESSKYAHFVALVELGRFDEAMKVIPFDEKGLVNPFHFLDVAIALRAAGKADESSRWLARGIELLDKGDGDTSRAAAVLRKTTPPSVAELEDIAMPPESKAIVVATLAQMHAGSHGEFAALARKLNIAAGYPHHLIETAMAAK